MRSIYKKLILVFIILSMLKIILSFLIPSPTMFADEYFYSSMARSLYKNFNFMISGSPSGIYTPLYSIVLSFAYIFKDMRIVYMIFKIINALLSSLIIFPVWLLTKEFLNERKSYLVAVLCGIWPGGFIFSFFVMAENLFYTLVLFTVYFAYKSFITKEIKWDFLTGLFLGLVFLTKMLGIALVFAIFVIFLIHLIIKKDFSQIKRKLLLYGVALLTVIPWLIRNGNLFGWTPVGIVGGIIGESYGNISFIKLGVILYWILIYFSYLILATGIIIFVFNLLSIKSNKNLKIFSYIIGICVFSFVVLASLHSAHYPNIGSWFVGRPLGRYIETCIPLMIILGFVNLKLKDNFYKNKLKYIVICAALIAIAFKLFSFKLFPTNAISLSYVGLINLGMRYLAGDFLRISIMTLIFVLLPFYLLFIKYINFKKLLYIIGLFFMMINIIAFSMVYYNSNYRWASLDQMQLGLWFNDNIDSVNVKVLFDERDNINKELINEDMSYSLKKIERRMIRAAFWMNAYIKIGNINEANKYNYLISKNDVDYKLIKQIGDFKLYKIE